MVRGLDLFLASLDHFEENLVRRQYLMLTPQEQETPGTALGSPTAEPRYQPLRVVLVKLADRLHNMRRGARLSVKQLHCTRDLFALLRWPHWLTGLVGIRLN